MRITENRRGQTPGIAGLMILLTGLTIGGCGPASSEGIGGARSSAAASPQISTPPAEDDDPLGISQSVRDIERQAQADVEWLEARRRAAAAQRDDDASTTDRDVSETQAAGSRLRRRPEIHFNDPPSVRRAPGSSESAPLASAEPALHALDPPSAPVRDDDPDRTVPIASEEFSVLLVRLRQELLEQSHRSGQPLRELIAMATMSIVDPDFRLDPEAFRGLTDTERDLLGHFQQFFARLGASLDGSAHADEVLIEAVGALREALRPAPQLIIRTAELCHAVEGFGRFTPFEPRRFLALAEQEAIIYLEIEGLHAEQNDRGDWVTRLSQEVQIFGARDRIPVWSEPWQSTVDRTNNRRRDFYTVWLIRLPRALATGEYFLKVRVRDEHTRAEAEASIPFEMVADPRMTGRPARN